MLLTLCSCVLIWVITGCNISSNSESKNKEATIAVACLITHASNQKRVDMDSLIYDTVNECTTNFGYLFGIRLDGQPKTVFADNLDIDERFKTASKERLALDVQKKASEELEKLNKIKAVQPEIDFLEGLREGATALRSLSKNISEKAIICTGSGVISPSTKTFLLEKSLAFADTCVIPFELLINTSIKTPPQSYFQTK